MNVFHSKAGNFILRLKISISFLNDITSRVTIFHKFSIGNMSVSKELSSIPMSNLAPPPTVRGMTILDREKFETEVQIPYLVISAHKMKTVLKVLKPCLLKIPKLLPIREEENNQRRVLINPKHVEGKQISVRKEFGDICVGDVMWMTVRLKYENWSSEDIFKAVLPEDTVGNVSSFSIIGHIIHLNLKPELLDYKCLIGQVLLDKYSNIKTVVNKCETIGNTFRNFKIEHLSGELNYQVLVKENTFKYEFDFEKVFWNPRLVKEHGEIVKMVNAGDVVFDVFAGVGPFAIPLAKKKCLVYANDLNPDSYHWLCHNAKLNKVEQYMHTYNLDGNVFIKDVLKSQLIQHLNSDEEKVRGVHILMNLPAAALTFLQSLVGLLAGESVKDTREMPTVYCYFFKRKDEEASDVISSYLCEESMRNSDISNVRLVAPNKLMMRVTYRIPKSILFSEHQPPFDRPSKRLKVSEEIVPFKETTT